MLMIWILVQHASFLNAQVQLIPVSDGGFETGTTFPLNGWTAVNDANSKWYVGTFAKSAGARGAYIDVNANAGTTNNYNSGAVRVSHIYRDVTIPAGATNIVLSFKWKANGELGAGADDYDFLRVFMVPTSTTPAAATLLPAVNIVGTSKYHLQGAAFQTATVTLSNSFAGATHRLVFTWRNDDSVTNNPGGAVDEISLTYIAGTGCSGTPNAGTAVSSSGTVCSGTSFTLSLSGASTATGLTYLWETSPNNSTWTSTSGTSATFATSQTSPTYYRCVVTCSGSSSNSGSVLVNMSPLIDCYCPPAYTSGCGIDYISNVTFATINNTTLCTGSTPTNLTKYSAPNPVLYRGFTYPLSVTTDGDEEAVRVWIDYTRNLIFESGESVLNGNAATVPATYTGNVTIPMAASLGQTVMRVRCRYTTNIGAGGSCNSFDFGETEDYLVTIADAPQCTGTPVAGTTVASTSIGCPAVTINFSLNGSATEQGLTYQWQTSPNNSTYTNVPSGGTANTYAATQSVNTWYRCVVTCSNGGASAESTPVQVTMGDACSCGTYCTASQDIGTCTDEYISNVNFNTINNSSTCSGTPTGYTNYTGISTSIQQGLSYNITVTNGSAFTDDQCHVFMDWNADGDWADTGEDIAATGGPTVFTATITVPLTSLVGVTRMRVRVFYTGATPACGLTDYGEAEDYCLNILAAAPCAGTPASSTTVASANPACFNLPFTLSLGTNYPYSGMTYQWQSAPDVSGSPGAFTNVPGIGNAATYSATQTTTTWYHCIIACSNGGSPVLSSDIKVTTQLCYCIPVYTAGCSNGDLITNLVLNTLSNNSGTACVATPPGYVVYPPSPANLTTTLALGITYVATISTTNTANANGTGVAAWIDFNDNGVFELTENFNNGATKFASNATGTLSITIPATAPPGNHRMRMRAMRNTLSDAIDPCDSQNANGEAEDYVITVAPPSAAVTGAVCEGGSIVLTAFPSGASSYSWTGPNGFASLAQNPSIPVTTMADTGTYTVTVVIGPATYTPSTHVSLFPRPRPYIFPNDTFLCGGAVINIVAKDSGFYAAGWPAGTAFDYGFGPGPDSTFVINGTGTYNVGVALPAVLGGCTSVSADADIFYRDAPYLQLDADSVSCYGTATGQITAAVLLGEGPFRYVYYNSSGAVLRDITTGLTNDTLPGLAAGQYYVVVYDTANSVYPPPSCRSDSLSVIIHEPTLLVPAETHTPILCNGNLSSVTISAEGGTPPYSGTGIFPQAAGTQTYNVTDANGCSASVVALITEPALLTQTLTSQHTPCTYLTGNINVANSGGTLPYSYLWSDGSTVASRTGLAASTYTLTVTDANGCTVSGDATVATPGPVTVAGIPTNLLCRGVSTGAISLSVTGGVPAYTYLWNGGSTLQNRTGLAAGTYTVTVKDANNCTKTKTFSITQPATNLIINTTQTNVRCFGLNSGTAGVAPSGGTPPYAYSWNTVPVKTTASVSSLTAGAYTCTVTDAIGCAKNVILTITEPPALSVFQTQSNVSFPGGNDGTASVAASGGTPGYTYSWNTVPVKTTATVTGLFAGTYKCTITDTKACNVKVTFIITEPISKADGSGNNAGDYLIEANPNPSTGLVTLSISAGRDELFRVLISDVTGRIIRNETHHAVKGINRMDYDFTGYEKGIYFIQVTSAAGNRVLRLVIE